MARASKETSLTLVKKTKRSVTSAKPAAQSRKPAGRRTSTNKGDAVAAEKSRRPGGRTERNRLLVANAVLRLVEDGNLDFELQEVAAISGLHRTTIFRRWPDREALISAALSEHLSHFKVPMTGNWQIDLRRSAFALRDFFTNPAELAMNRLLVRTTNADFRRQVFEMWNPFFRSIEETLQEAQRNGEISMKVDCEVVVGMLSSTLLARILVGLENDDDYVERLVSQIIRCCR